MRSSLNFIRERRILAVEENRTQLDPHVPIWACHNRRTYGNRQAVGENNVHIWKDRLMCLYI